MCAVRSVPSQDFGSGGHRTREVATADTIPASSHAFMEAGVQVEGSYIFGVAEIQADEESDGAASTQPTPVAPFHSVEDALEYDLTRQDSDTESVVSASDAESNGSVEGPPTAAIDTPIEQEVRVGLPRNVTLRMALVTLDEVDPNTHFRQRAAVMKSVPQFLRGPFRNALKLALEEATWGNSRDDEVRQERGWKLLMLLPRMLLHRPPGGGLMSRAKLVERFQAFARGEWISLFRTSEVCNEKAVESRVRRAENLVHVGEVSSARQALEGAAVAPGTQATLDKLQDVRRRPPQPREALPPGIMGFQPPTLFQLDEKLFGRNLRSARRGVAGGPSGMTCEHLRPLLDERRAMQLLFKLGENLARAHVPQVVESMVRSGRMTALSKLDGGVRGIVSGDVIRRLVARTMAQQLGPAVKSATAPHEYALSTSRTPPDVSLKTWLVLIHRSIVRPSHVHLLGGYNSLPDLITASRSGFASNQSVGGRLGNHNAAPQYIHENR